MSTNKHAQIRYITLDRCFSNFNHKYSFEDLIEECCDAINREKGDCNGISDRTLREDLKYMRSDDGYRAIIEVKREGNKRYYRYQDKNFSINKQPLSTTELEQLKNTIIMLNRFKGLPQFEWMNEVVARLEGSFNINSNIDEVVGFEQNPYLKGLQHFNDLFDAIINKQVLRVVYHPAFKSAMNYTLHPYYLKQYNNRWFLLGRYTSKTRNSIMNMALDRIESFEPVNLEYKPNTDIDFNEHFDDIVGVTVPDNEKPQLIKLRVEKERYNYIESKPIHHSQKEIKGESDEQNVVIELNLMINYEFETLLLGFANSVDIIEPLSLKEKIKERAKAIIIKNA